MELKVRCLAFPEDLALMAESEQEVIEQIEKLKEITEKAGLQISIWKTAKTNYEEIKTVKRFKYLRQWVS